MPDVAHLHGLQPSAISSNTASSSSNGVQSKHFRNQWQARLSAQLRATARNKLESLHFWPSSMLYSLEGDNSVLFHKKVTRHMSNYWGFMSGQMSVYVEPQQEDGAALSFDMQLQQAPLACQQVSHSSVSPNVNADKCYQANAGHATQSSSKLHSRGSLPDGATCWLHHSRRCMTLKANLLSTKDL